MAEGYADPPNRRAMKLYTAEQSRNIDRLSQSKYGVPSFSLMTRAGEAVAAWLLHQKAAGAAREVVVFAGKGNNGGDGMVAARRLLQAGRRVHILLLCQAGELRGDAAKAHDELVAHGGRIVEVTSPAQLGEALPHDAGVIVDAIFGTGLNAPVMGLAGGAISLINSLKLPIVTVDIASGINADTGAVMGCAVKADATITFGVAKFGHVTYPGAAHCGELEIVDIGFARGAVEEVGCSGVFATSSDIGALLPRRVPDSHKGLFGHVLIVAGARGKSGAALLAARGALRSGAGLVTAAVPESVGMIVAAGQAELMTEPLSDHDGHFEARGAAERLGLLMEHKGSLVVGPGVGVSEDTRALMEYLIDQGAQPGRPMLIDADGLNAVAELGAERLRASHGPIVLTPHPGEAARLLRTDTNAINADRISSAKRLADLTGAAVLLKGARTVIADPPGLIYVNPTGNAGMGTPGMGDVLSGIVGALLGMGLTPLEALAAGAFVHGAAADRVAARVGTMGYIAGDLIAELPSTFDGLIRGAAAGRSQ